MTAPARARDDAAADSPKGGARLPSGQQDDAADRSAAKSPDAFRTISEVSAEIDVPQHVLRFWETRFPQIKPLKRGGGRRLYRPDHVALLKGIRALLYDDGLTIKGVQKVLREQGVRSASIRGSAESGLAVEVRGEDDGPAIPRRSPTDAAAYVATSVEQAIDALEALHARLTRR